MTTLNRQPIHEIVDIREIWLRDPLHARDLFAAGFSLYCQCFPDENEREPSSVLEGYLDDQSSDWRMLLAMDKTGRVIGGRNVNVLSTRFENRTIPFAWGEHLYVDPAPQFRRKGIGSALVESSNTLLAKTGIMIVFSEQNDPFLMSREQYATDLASGISPEERLRFWGQLGYMAINAPYLQPPLKGGEPVRYLRLCCHIPDPSAIPASIAPATTTISAQAYLHLVRHFHSTFVTNLASDPTSAELRDLILSGPGCLTLTDIQEKRSFAQQLSFTDKTL